MKGAFYYTWAKKITKKAYEIKEKFEGLKLNIDEKLRAEDLSIQDYANIANEINNKLYTADNTNRAELLDTTRKGVVAPDFLQGIYACKSDNTSTATGCPTEDQIK